MNITGITLPFYQFIFLKIIKGKSAINSFKICEHKEKNLIQLSTILS